MDLEQWTVNLFKSIEEAANNGENFDLHLENEAAKEIASAYNETKWIEIY
jgi:hypothetical protein